jgi:hypothetical protein
VLIIGYGRQRSDLQCMRQQLFNLSGQSCFLPDLQHFFLVALLPGQPLFRELSQHLLQRQQFQLLSGLQSTLRDLYQFLIDLVHILCFWVFFVQLYLPIELSLAVLFELFSVCVLCDSVFDLLGGGRLLLLSEQLQSGVLEQLLSYGLSVRIYFYQSDLRPVQW